MNTVIYDVTSVYEYSNDRMKWKNAGGRKNHIIAYQLTGSFDHKVRGELLSVHSDTLFFIHKDDSYSVKCLESGKSLCVCFSADTNLVTKVYDARDDARVGNIFKKIMLESALDCESKKYSVVARLYELFSIISSASAPSYVAPDKREQMSTVHGKIMEYYREKEFHVNELSSLCGVGQKQFTKLFRQRYGTTPTQFVLALRMNTAAKLIEEGHMSISEVADFVGYDDVFYFSRLFKKNIGVSPTEYRKRNKKQ